VAGLLARAFDKVGFLPSLGVLAGAAVVGLGTTLVLFVVAGWLAFAICVGLMVGSIPFYVIAGRRADVHGREYERVRQQLERQQLDYLTHVEELRGINAVDYGARHVGALSDREHGVALRAIRSALASSLVTEFLAGVSVGLVAMVVGFALLGGRMSLLHALIAVLLSAESVGAVRRLGLEFHRSDDAIASDALLRSWATPTVSRTSATLLRADNLTTPQMTTPVTIEVAAGSRLLVRGVSGAGKTTLLNTLIGHTAPVEGRVEHAMTPVALVTPTTALLDGPLASSFGVSEEVVRPVLAELGLSDVQVLGVDGDTVSSGQRVRLAIARGIVNGAQLLVIDDVAGLLDVASLALVRDALARRPSLGVIEAASGTSVLSEPTAIIEVGAS
jgi:ABC-type transport system involved in cytochrome bd biosynthesis fused ATPase/permease subunit